MIIENVEVPANAASPWRLTDPLGQQFTLPPSADGTIRIGLLGTRMSLVRGRKIEALARTLKEIDGPIQVVDVRRSGVGGMGNWGPYEFATVLPDMLAGRPYAYFHLPSAAPTASLLKAWRAASRSSVPDRPSLSPEEVYGLAAGLEDGRIGNEAVPAFAWAHWQLFRAAYIRDLPETALLAARALVEGAASKGGVAVFICSEERIDAFATSNQAQCDGAYCHRYTLANRVAASIAADRAGRIIERLELRPDAPIHRDRYRDGHWHRVGTP